MTTPETPGQQHPPTPPTAPTTALTPPQQPQQPPAGHRPDPAPGIGRKGPIKPPSKSVMFGVAGLILGALLGIAGTSIVTAAVADANTKAAAEAEAKKPRPIPEAISKCNLGSDTAAKVGDNGHSLSLDGAGKKDYYGLSMDEIDCTLGALNVPDSIRDQMGTTRALDGTQKDSWGNFTVSWKYHPDDGLTVNIKDEAK